MEKAKNVKNVWAHSVWAANLHNISSRFHVLRLNISVALNFTAIYTWQFYLDWMAFLRISLFYLRFVDVVNYLLVILPEKCLDRGWAAGGRKRPILNSNNVMFGKLNVCVGAQILLFLLRACACVRVSFNLLSRFFSSLSFKLPGIINSWKVMNLLHTCWYHRRQLCEWEEKNRLRNKTRRLC